MLVSHFLSIHRTFFPRLLPCPLLADLWRTTSPSSPAGRLNLFNFQDVLSLVFHRISRDGQTELHNIL